MSVDHLLKISVGSVYRCKEEENIVDLKQS